MRNGVLHRLATLGFLVLLLGGCSGLRHDAPVYEKDGVRYGVTRGTFRNRWWNYYERGCSYLDGGYYEEAEKDFRAALQGRARDQRWPRTYGLHFIPEYFPNRELGVALYHQQRLEESIGQIETSLEQHFTARAAFFLAEARRGWLIAQGVDAESPGVDIIAPGAGTAVGATEVVLQGIARDDTYIETIAIDGSPYDVRLSAVEVPFEKSVVLAPGQNTIRVEATNLLGNTSVVHVPVLADVDGPLVSFDTPVALPGVVRGVAFDPSGVETLTIAGRDVALTPGDDGTVAFSVALTMEEMTPPLRYECTDRLGNSTRGVLPLDLLVLDPDFPDMVFAGLQPAAKPLGRELYALSLQGGYVAVAAAPTRGTGVAVELSNIVEGQQYFMDEIVLALDVTGDNPIEQVELNGEALPAMPGRTSFRTSRRIRLTDGDNLLTARAVDSAGVSGTDQRTVRREPTAIEMTRNKLAVAFLGNLSAAGAALDEDGEYIMNVLAATAPVQRRFNVVDRSLLQEILAEQSLSESLASRQNKLALGNLIPAEMMIAARIRRDRDSIEIVLEGSSTETAVRILPRVDVAGPHAELDQLIETLGLRLAQELPRVQGRVIQWDAPELITDLNARQGIRDYLKCIVFRTEAVLHPETGEPLGERPIILCEGVLNQVTEGFSTAEVLRTEDGDDLDTLNIETGHYVVIK